MFNAEKVKILFLKNKKIALICILGIAGITLIFLSEIGKTDKKAESENVKETQVSQTDYSKEIEQKLTDIISSIENAGVTKVMVTLDSVSESVYAANEKSDTDEKGNSYSNDYIIIENDSGEGGLVIKEKQPQIKGVAIVCQGGNNPVVRQQITDAVTAVLGINSNRVSISKMK